LLASSRAVRYDFRLLIMKLSLFVLLTATTLLAQSASRTWTSTDGRKIEAAFVSSTAEVVKIRLANGSTFEVPLARLSVEDQAFVKTQTSGAAPTEATAALKEWPRTITLADKPEVVVVREDEAKKEFVYRSPHYEFVCDSKLGSNVVREFWPHVRGHL
jgi:hypothetical protein